MNLQIEKAIYGGAGLARHEGKAIFVPLALPGETVEVELQHSKASYAEAKLTQVIAASGHRVHPPCRHYGDCGGCHYQHADYDEQVRMKAAILRESMERSGIADVPAIEAITAAPFAYRNRIRLHIRQTPFAFGYLRGRSHALLPIDECPIAAPSLMNAAHVLQKACATDLSGWTREIELFTDAAGEQILISIYTSAGTSTAARKLNNLWPVLHAALPEAVGCAAFTMAEDKSFPALAAQAGHGHITYIAAGQSYRVSAGSFFQVNKFLIDRMAAEVCSGRAGRLAWDLYAGVGLFARHLAQSFDQVVAVEAAPSSVTDMRTNLPDTKIMEKTTLQFLREVNDGHADSVPDYVVLDPPRAGLGTEGAKLLANVRAPQVTYVSCDPATLSRDLSTLLKSGYRLRKLQLIDMFPQTFHLESIAHLSLD